MSRNVGINSKKEKEKHKKGERDGGKKNSKYIKIK